MLNQQDLNKIYWHSRRGMLELDLLLVPFAREQLIRLSETEQTMYQELLEQEDQDLFSWLISKSKAPTKDQQAIIDLILSYNSSKESGVTI